MSSAIHADAFLPHPPEKVWRALTDPELLASWLMPNDFQPRLGHRFTFRTQAVPAHGFDGIVHCRVLDLVLLERLRISWTGGGIDTTVTWQLTPEGAGTRLFLDHEGQLRRRACRGRGSAQGTAGHDLLRTGRQHLSGRPGHRAADLDGVRGLRPFQVGLCTRARRVRLPEVNTGR
jgi:uncharacterized protein YndB with AHSA1/START domain